MSAVNDILTAIQRIIPSLNTSNAGLFSRIAQVVGSFIDIVRLEMLRSEQTVQQATKIARITTQQYYVDRAYAYQSGDRLVVIDPATQELGYATIDETKQIQENARKQRVEDQKRLEAIKAQFDQMYHMPDKGSVNH